MLRRSGGSECAGEEINLSPTRISPALGSTKPAISRSVVVLPQPEGPSRQTRWPCSMASEISSTTAIVAISLGQAPQFDRRHANPPVIFSPFAGDCYVPVKAGLRFSMNAVRPSV